MTSEPLLLLALACGGGEPSASGPDPLVQASAQATPGTVGGLGPHRFVVNTERTRPGRSTPTVEVVEVAWIDGDNFQIRRLRDGRPSQEVRVLDNRAWSRSGEQAFSPGSEVGIYKNELWTAFGAFDQALEPFGEQMRLGQGSSTLVEGRPAMEMPITLEPAPEGAPPSRGHQPVALEGRLVLDKATAVPLLGEAEGRYLERGHADREVTVRVRLTRSGFGELPVIEAPGR